MTARLTKVTATDVDTGESEMATISPDSYIVICGPDRYLAHTAAHANGTVTLTLRLFGKEAE